MREASPRWVALAKVWSSDWPDMVENVAWRAGGGEWFRVSSPVGASTLHISGPRKKAGKFIKRLREYYGEDREAFQKDFPYTAMMFFGGYKLEASSRKCDDGLYRLHMRFQIPSGDLQSTS